MTEPGSATGSFELDIDAGDYGQNKRYDMDKYEEILERLNQLGIVVRKMVREQRSLLKVHEQVAAKHDELRTGNEELKLRQEELMRVMKSMSGRMAGLDEEVWLDKAGVIDYLNISKRTFERRVKTEGWKRKRNGEGWKYLKSSLVR